jgi:hypothetical protein
MDINPLISDLKKYKEELLDTIEIAMGFDELTKADVYIAHAKAEINGEWDSPRPFHQVADIYHLPLDEVVANIRDFTNKGYKSFLIFEPQDVPDIDFDSDMDSLD